MSDWFHELPISWMSLLVFGFTYVLTFAIHVGVAALARRGYAKSFKAVSPGMLSPLGVIFGLFVAFTAAQVWSDNDRASAAVTHEASALRTALVVAASLPAEQEAKLHDLIRAYAHETATMEWPMMAHRNASLNVTPLPIQEALQLVLSSPAINSGQQAAQREITNAIEAALDARRQRIIVSRAEVNAVKWSCLYLQAICALLAIALVHCDDRLSSLIALGLFATGTAASVLLIAAHDRPFVGQIAVTPDPLLQIISEPVTKR
ncbi:hypothetical protein ACE103_13425 [Bradyrhizobium sp. ma5]|uniref:bestrophin-like domain n=1 Tax=Bradyrhizobium sp. ma5 TaxID=3344828 RepID=UPI0035D4D71D